MLVVVVALSNPVQHVRERSDHRWLRRLGATGLRVAHSLVVLGISSAALVLSTGCLVTEDILFEGQDDVPPSFVFRPRSVPPIGDILEVNADTREVEGMTNLEFNVQVLDPNVQQALETQIRLRTLANASPASNELLVINEDGLDIPGTGSAVRDFRFSFLTTVLREGQCHQLELAVSGDFQEGADDERYFALPTRPGDVAVATWWIWETSISVNPDTCPTNDFP